MGTGVEGGRGYGPQGGESWKERIKKSQLAQAVAADRRMQRLAQAQEKMQGGEGADGGGGVLVGAVLELWGESTLLGETPSRERVRSPARPVWRMLLDQRCVSASTKSN